MHNLIDTVRPYVSTELFLLMLVMGTFLLGVIIYKRTKIALLQPLLISILIIIHFLKFMIIGWELLFQN